MTYKIGSLSDQGWIDDPQSILNYTVACYLLSDYGQSLHFAGNINSLPYTYYQHINDPDKMATAMNRDLTNELSRYFPTEVSVKCTAKALEGSKYAILVQVSVLTEDNRRFDLARVMEVSTANLRKIIQINNGDEQTFFNNL